jgi:hypothetical protein
MSNGRNRVPTRILTNNYNYTPGALEDRLLIEIHSKQKYIEKARRLIYRINVSKPWPTFVISEGDIPLELVKALEGLGDITMKRIVTNVIRRLYESVNFDYYHTSGMYSKVRWRFED